MSTPTKRKITLELSSKKSTLVKDRPSVFQRLGTKRVGRSSSSSQQHQQQQYHTQDTGITICETKEEIVRRIVSAVDEPKVVNVPESVAAHARIIQAQLAAKQLSGKTVGPSVEHQAAGAAIGSTSGTAEHGLGGERVRPFEKLLDQPPIPHYYQQYHHQHQRQTPSRYHKKHHQLQLLQHSEDQKLQEAEPSTHVYKKLVSGSGQLCRRRSSNIQSPSSAEGDSSSSSIAPAGDPGSGEAATWDQSSLENADQDLLERKRQELQHELKLEMDATKVKKDQLGKKLKKQLIPASSHRSQRQHHHVHQQQQQQLQQHHRSSSSSDSSSSSGSDSSDSETSSSSSSSSHTTVHRRPKKRHAVTRVLRASSTSSESCASTITKLSKKHAKKLAAAHETVTVGGKRLLEKKSAIGLQMLAKTICCQKLATSTQNAALSGSGSGGGSSSANARKAARELSQSPAGKISSKYSVMKAKMLSAKKEKLSAIDARERVREKERELALREKEREREKERMRLRERERERLKLRVVSPPIPRARTTISPVPVRGSVILKKKSPERRVSPPPVSRYREIVPMRRERSPSELLPDRERRRHEALKERERRERQERQERDALRSKERQEREEALVRCQERSRERDRLTVKDQQQHQHLHQQPRTLRRVDRDNDGGLEKPDRHRPVERLLPRPAERARALAAARSPGKSVDRDRSRSGSPRSARLRDRDRASYERLDRGVYLEVHERRSRSRERDYMTMVPTIRGARRESPHYERHTMMGRDYRADTDLGYDERLVVRGGGERGVHEYGRDYPDDPPPRRDHDRPWDREPRVEVEHGRRYERSEMGREWESRDHGPGLSGGHSSHGREPESYTTGTGAVSGGGVGGSSSTGGGGVGGGGNRSWDDHQWKESESWSTEKSERGLDLEWKYKDRQWEHDERGGGPPPPSTSHGHGPMHGPSGPRRSWQQTSHGGGSGGGGGLGSSGSGGAMGGPPEWHSVKGGPSDDRDYLPHQRSLNDRSIGFRRHPHGPYHGHARKPHMGGGGGIGPSMQNIGGPSRFPLNKYNVNRTLPPGGGGGSAASLMVPSLNQSSTQHQHRQTPPVASMSSTSPMHQISSASQPQQLPSPQQHQQQVQIQPNAHHHIHSVQQHQRSGGHELIHSNADCGSTMAPHTHPVAGGFQQVNAASTITPPAQPNDTKLDQAMNPRRMANEPSSPEPAVTGTILEGLPCDSDGVTTNTAGRASSVETGTEAKGSVIGVQDGHGDQHRALSRQQATEATDVDNLSEISDDPDEILSREEEISLQTSSSILPIGNGTNNKLLPESSSECDVVTGVEAKLAPTLQLLAAGDTVLDSEKNPPAAAVLCGQSVVSKLPEKDGEPMDVSVIGATESSAQAMDQTAETFVSSDQLLMDDSDTKDAGKLNANKELKEEMDLDFEEISDGELEEENKCKALGDPLGVDWGSLAQDSHLKPVRRLQNFLLSPRNRWKAHHILLETGISVRLAGMSYAQRVLAESKEKLREELDQYQSGLAAHNIRATLETKPKPVHSCGGNGDTGYSTDDPQKSQHSAKVESSLTSDANGLEIKTERTDEPQRSFDGVSCAVGASVGAGTGEHKFESTPDGAIQASTTLIERFEQDLDEIDRIRHPVADMQVAFREHLLARRNLILQTEPVTGHQKQCGRALSVRYDYQLRRQLCGYPVFDRDIQTDTPVLGGTIRPALHLQIAALCCD
ncbi:uncharacterized protein LOC131213370 [Anopheles bellator]|uniref:uncharacterized protein LOC131213370 n=1 Tax=Anopheles bellator TaxID=139047 RepID=UPI0026494B84|nr:uncharacterized protein LOC131213370 [Anopheles bellator]